MTKENNQTQNTTLQTRKAWWWLATWFGSGLSPKAPGTVGSLTALPFAFLIQHYSGNFALLIAAIVLFFIGWWSSNKYMGYYPEKHDPKEIVVDEVAGIWLLLWFATPEKVSASTNLATLILYLACFTLFRFFDVLKPYPISVADHKIKGGFGVMFDDILAAVYPMITMFIIFIIIMSSNISSGDVFKSYIGVWFGEQSCDENYDNCDP